MKQTTKSRALSLILVLAMVFSMLPPSVFAAESSATWSKVELAEITADDTIAITMTNPSGVTYVLPSNETSRNSAPVVTVSDDGSTLTTGTAANYSWTITPVDGGFTITTGDSYLSVQDTNNGVQVGAAEAVWTVSSGYLATPIGGNTRYLGVYDNNNGDYSAVASPNWRCYKNTTGNTKNQTLSFWKLNQDESTPTEPEEPAPEALAKYQLTDSIADGDTVLLFNASNSKVLTSEVSGYNLAGLSADPVEDVIATDSATAPWTVSVNDDGTYSFTQDGLTLSIIASGKYFNLKTDGSGDPAWILTESAEGSGVYFLSSGTLSNSYGPAHLEYYNGFTGYASNSPDEKAFGIQFYKLVEEDSEEPTEPSQPEEPTEPSDPEVPEVAYAEKMSALPNHGDTIIIYNAGNAMGAVPSGKKMSGIAAEAIDGKLPISDEMAQLLVETDNAGNYSFTLEGKYLTSAPTGNGLSLEEELTDCGKWTFEAAVDGSWYIKNVGANFNGNYNQALEYYSGFTTYGIKETPIYQMELYLVSAAPVYPVPDGTYVIWAPGYNMALSSEYTGFYNKGTAVTEAEDQLSGYTAADIWTVTNNGDDTLSISFDGQNLAMADSFSSMTLGEVHDKWVLEDAGNGLFYVKNTVRGAYIEWYASKNNWSGYNKISSGSEGMFALRFTPVQPMADSPSALPAEGEQVVIYNIDAQGVLGAENDTQSIENVPAVLADGSVTAGNGGVIFTVEKNGEYHRFHNETYGYLCSSGTGNNAFYSTEASDDADWTLEELGIGFRMLSRTAKYNGNGAQYLEYYSDSYKTYSFYATNKDGSDSTGIYTFLFCPCANESVTEGIVNQPDVIFGTANPATVGTDYTFTFSMDTVFGVKELKVFNPTLEKEYEYTLEADLYTVIIPAADIDAIAEKLAAEGIDTPVLSLSISGSDTKDVPFANGSAIDIKDEPSIGEVTPAPSTETGENKMPVITAVISNAGEAPAITMTVGGNEVEAVYADGIISYTPTEALADGRTTVTVTVKRTDGKEAAKTWTFIVGQAQYQLYFGQLHSHTTYSDGSGSLESALDYIASLPESANVDFVAFTDHSNYFDASGAANPEGALYDMSLATTNSVQLWTSYKNAIADFNTRQDNVIAIGGFEMTWSGGPGHINTFATPGIVSRNNSTLNNKTGDAGMKAYYSLLSQPEGMDSINQFNHPGNTFGTFSDFAYWDALIDTRIQLVEVGNGEGQVGAGGYFPSYEYYTMALDKGWHVAPTNNQDNHKGKWGNANEARDVILTDDFTEEGIYAAIRAMRMYATEDKNLEIGYSVNGQLLGSSIEEVPEKLSFLVTVYDPDSSDSISKVELIVNSGKVAYTWDDPADLADGTLEATLDPTYSYYYVRVTEGDGDLAVTAPVWVGESLKLGISSVQTATTTPVTKEALKISTTLFNSEGTEATVKSLTYTTAGDLVVGCDTTGYTIPASGTLAVDFAYTPTAAKLTTITVTAVVDLEGTEYTFSMDIELDVQDADKLVYIGIDASHYNEYVNGNYKESMGNFTQLASQYGVRAVTLFTSEELTAACSNEKYKALILTAPSRRNGSALRDPYVTYSDEEIAAVKAFNEAGGTVILTGWGDFYESYAPFPAEDHMAAQQNKILAALGSSLRIADDETKDDTYNGGQAQRLYLSVYDFDSFLLDGVEFDAENPHDNMYTELYSQYGGSSIYVVDAQGNPTASVPSTVTPAVYGFDTTYSADDDKDNYGALGSTQKYTVGDSQHLMVLASEQLEGQGLIVVAGAAFLSNFEVQATIEDSGAEKNYSNYKICANLLSSINPVTITPIEDVMAQSEPGYKYTIEGTVTSNASGYDKDTAFFDCIYVQDATGGICCFPVAGNYQIGDKVRITGTTEFYQGEPELQVTSIEVIGKGEAVQPAVVTAAEVNDGSVLGKLITLSGKVTSFELANGLVQTILVQDENGDTARVFIDGYITTAEDVKDLSVGCGITVTGLASYDDTFNAPDGPFPRIRIRDRADVVCTAHIHDFTETNAAPTCVADGYIEYLCDCGYSYRDTFVPATGHNTASEVVQPTHDTMGYTITSCADCDYSYIHSFVDAQAHEFVKEVTREATCTAEGEWTFTCDCGETYTQVIPVTGHSCTATVIAPDCEKFGYTLYQCSSCDYSYLSDPTEPTGHSYVGKYVGNDLMQYTCQCGHTYTTVHKCATAAFTDLDPNGWYHDATDYILTQGIMVGTGEAAFSPETELTRGQIVTMLYRMAGEPEVDAETPFVDVPEDAYYADAVAWGYSTGVVQGMCAYCFCPDYTVTREQMVTFIHRYAGKPAPAEADLSGFADEAQIGAYAYDAMVWAVSEGIINGITADTLAPKASTTRVQAAVILCRYLTRN